jgi:AcrR family transcriptional regulator
MKVVMSNNVVASNNAVNAYFIRYAEKITLRPYHHGNLREELLARAMEIVRERGVAELSLRELARDVGVSHAAPRRHFADRQALLDALAVAGYARFGEVLRAAADAATDEDYVGRMRAEAHAFIGFATTNADLLELMFSSKHGAHADEVEIAAQAAFGPVLELILSGQESGLLPAGDPERVGLVHLATIQGIATLLATGMVTPDQVDGLIEDATTQFLAAAAVQTQA